MDDREKERECHHRKSLTEDIHLDNPVDHIPILTDAGHRFLLDFTYLLIDYTRKKVTHKVLTFEYNICAKYLPLHLLTFLSFFLS